MDGGHCCKKTKMTNWRKTSHNVFNDCKVGKRHYSLRNLSKKDNKWSENQVFSVLHPYWPSPPHSQAYRPRSPSNQAPCLGSATLWSPLPGRGVGKCVCMCVCGYTGSQQTSAPTPRLLTGLSSAGAAARSAAAPTARRLQRWLHHIRSFVCVSVPSLSGFSSLSPPEVERTYWKLLWIKASAKWM